MSLSSIRALSRSLAATAAIVAGAATAGAQTTADAPTAEVLFAEGRRLVGQGRYADACPKFAESQRLDPAIGTLLNLGDCYEKLGRTASAWARFREAAETAHRANDAKREALATERAEALAGSLATLAIAVPAANEVPGLEILRDGIAMGRAVWGSPAPVDPGEHVVEARAPGYKSWSASVNVDPTQPAASISVPRLEDAAPSPAPPPEATPRTSPQRVAGVVTLGVGLGAIGAGALFGILAAVKKGDSGEHCAGDVCDARGVALREQAIAFATASTVTFTVGLVGTAGGTLIFLTAPSRPPKTAAIRLSTSVAPSAINAVLDGVF